MDRKNILLRRLQKEIDEIDVKRNKLYDKLSDLNDEKDKKVKEMFSHLND